jgi:hypothetical protein
MKRKLIVVLVTVMVCAGVAGGVVAQSRGPNAPDAVITTKFTHQGQLKRNGVLFNGTCAMRFTLWDAVTAGVQQASYTVPAPVNVSEGVFAVEVDFGAQFKGEARWIQTETQCADDAAYTTLPRVALNAVPYAMSLIPGAIISTTVSTDKAGVYGRNTNSTNYSVGVWGRADAAGAFGVYGSSAAGQGVRGDATSGYGVVGISASGDGVRGQTTSGKSGVYGQNDNSTAYSIGVWGRADAAGAFGVYGSSGAGQGVSGNSTTGPGVVGLSVSGDGVRGQTTSGKSGVYGQNDNSTAYSTGMWGRADAAGAFGVYGSSGAGQAIRGDSTTGHGVVGTSTSGDGVRGQSVTGYAGYFIGKVGITGGADLAELFNVSAGTADPGTLLIIDAANPGQLTISTHAYDTKVAGIISGAGGVNPGLTLLQAGVMDGDTHVAIAGRVYVKATAINGAIEPGDLLTTSDRPGYAMKATDRDRVHGAIIGKAMTGLQDGTGLVLVLVNLQ